MGVLDSPITDLDYLKGIRENDTKVLEEIYSSYLGKISNMIIRNNGTFSEAKDVFQEAIVIIFKKAKDPDFELTSTFYNYLYSVSKFIWLRQLKKKYRTEVTIEGDEGYSIEENIENEILESEKKKLFRKKFLLLGEECQKVMQYFFNGMPLKKIASEMGYTDEYAKRKKYKCKEQLVKSIQKDATYAELRRN